MHILPVEKRQYYYYYQDVVSRETIGLTEAVVLLVRWRFLSFKSVNCHRIRWAVIGGILLILLIALLISYGTIEKERLTVDTGMRDAV